MQLRTAETVDEEARDGSLSGSASPEGAAGGAAAQGEEVRDGSSLAYRGGHRRENVMTTDNTRSDARTMATSDAITAGDGGTAGDSITGLGAALLTLTRYRRGYGGGL